MRKLYDATGGQPQRWESLGNLGAVKADAAGIAYAVERGWLIAEAIHRIVFASRMRGEHWSITARTFARSNPLPNPEPYPSSWPTTDLPQRYPKQV
jgi:hypothetical protein